MKFINFLKRKYIRLQGSKNILKLNYIIEKYFRDKKLGDVGLDFSSKPKREFVIQKIINTTIALIGNGIKGRDING